MPFLFYRFLIAVLILTPYALIYKRAEIWKLLRNRLTWMIGISEVCGLTVQYFGQETVPAGLAALLSLLFILIVPFISPFLLDEKLTKTHLIAMIIAFTGVFLISSEGNLSNLKFDSLIGVLLLIGAAFAYAFYIMFSAMLNKNDKEADAFALFYLVMMIITGFTALNTMIFDKFQRIPTPAYKWLLGLAIFSTIIAFLFYFLAVREISANVASVLLPLQALVPFIIDYFYVGRRYSGWVISGALLIVLAMVLVVGEPFYLQFRMRNQIKVRMEEPITGN